MAGNPRPREGSAVGDGESILSGSSSSSKTTLLGMPTDATHEDAELHSRQDVYAMPCPSGLVDAGEGSRSPTPQRTIIDDDNKETEKDLPQLPTASASILENKEAPIARHRRTASSSGVPVIAADFAAPISTNHAKHISWEQNPARTSSPKDDATIGAAAADSSGLGLLLDDRTSQSNSDEEVGGAWTIKRALSEISRTPSQSTTGTSKTHNSLETAASSLQSGGSSGDARLDESSSRQESASKVLSPEILGTALPSPDELANEKKDMNALRRYYALLELVQSECEYVEDLDILVNIYFDALEQMSFFDSSPSRLETVRRNGPELLRAHRHLAMGLVQIVDECEINPEADGSDIDKAHRSDEAIVRAAELLSQSANAFEHYHYFCSMQAEADRLLSEARAQHNGSDFAAYERLCSNLVRSSSRTSTPRHMPSSRRSSATNIPVTGLTQLNTDNTAAASVPGSPTFATSPQLSAPPSGTTTPSGSVASFGASSTARMAQNSRLRFGDYHIKPVQRLCRYGLFLNAILQFAGLDDAKTRRTLHHAIDRLDDVSSSVDQASLRRQKEVVSDTLFSRLERPVELSDEFVQSLGPPEMIGVVDAFYHHSILQPLTTPLRFNRTGLILWAELLAFVRVRKNKHLVCQSYLPLRDIRLEPQQLQSKRHDVVRGASGGQSVLRHSFRLSYLDHHFEFSARSDRERSLWHNAIRLAIKNAPSDLAGLPCSFPSIPPLDTGSSDAMPLNELLNAHTRPSSSSSSKDTVIKYPSVAACTHFDRLMTFSDVFKETNGGAGYAVGTTGNTSGTKDIYEAVVAQQARSSPGPSISSTVVGLAKMATTQVPNVMRSRRTSGVRPQDTATLKGSPSSSALNAFDEGKNGTTAKHLMSSKRGSNSTMRVGHSNADQSAPASPVSHVSSHAGEGLGTRFRNSFRRPEPPLPPSKSASLPLHSRPASPHSRPALDIAQSDARNQEIAQHEAKVSSTARISPHEGSGRTSFTLLDTFSGMGRRRRSPSLQSVMTTGELSSGDSSPAFLTPSEEHGDHFGLTSSPPRLSPTEKAQELPGSDMEVLASSTDTAGPASRRVSFDVQSSAQSSRRSSLAMPFAAWSGFEAQDAQGPPVTAASTSRIASSPNSSLTQVREGAAASLRRARSGAWKRLSTFGAPVTMGPSTGSLAYPQASSIEAKGTLSRSPTDPYPRSQALHQDESSFLALERGARSSIESVRSRGSTSSSNTPPIARLRGSLRRSLTARSRSQPAGLTLDVSPDVIRSPDTSSGMLASPGSAELDPAALANISKRLTTRRASVVESPLLTEQAVHSVRENARDSPSTESAEAAGTGKTPVLNSRRSSGGN